MTKHTVYKHTRDKQLLLIYNGIIF